MRTEVNIDYQLPVILTEETIIVAQNNGPKLLQSE